MNRRKLFGILAAAPAAAVAASVKPNDNGFKFGFTGFKEVALQSIQEQSFIHGRPMLSKRPKCYSAWNYESIIYPFIDEYRRKKYGLGTDKVVFRDCENDSDICYDEENRRTQLDGYTTMAEMYQAFAEACLNGEVPGVWWE